MVNYLLIVSAMQLCVRACCAHLDPSVTYKCCFTEGEEHQRYWLILANYGDELRARAQSFTEEPQIDMVGELKIISSHMRLSAKSMKFLLCVW